MLKQNMFFGCAVVAIRYIECCCNPKTSKQFLGYSLLQGFSWPQQGWFKNGLKSPSVFCLIVCLFAVLFCFVLFPDRNRKRELGLGQCCLKWMLHGLFGKEEGIICQIGLNLLCVMWKLMFFVLLKRQMNNNLEIGQDTWCSTL